MAEPASGPAHEGFRDGGLPGGLLPAIARESRRLGPVRLMHVCGTHERSIGRHGLRSLLPPDLRLVAGPGCPVCVCPVRDIAAARELAKGRRAIVASFGDMLAVPAPGGSLLDARAAGADVRLVLSARDAVGLARGNPGDEVVFLAVGFEATAATTAAAIAPLGPASGPEEAPRNFSLISSSRLVPPALLALFGAGGEPRSEGPGKAPPVDGLILPGHVCVVTGEGPFLPLAEGLGIPCAIAGFEAVDVLAAVLDLLRQIGRGKAEVSNVYSRAVSPRGNSRAQALLDEAFDVVDADWRGLGLLPGSGLALKPAYRGLDALQRFGVERDADMGEDPGTCLCAEVLLGAAESEDCPRFGRGCAPESPEGPCMVSEEGTCRIRYEYGGAR